MKRGCVLLRFFLEIVTLYCTAIIITLSVSIEYQYQEASVFAEVLYEFLCGIVFVEVNVIWVLYATGC